MDVASPQIERVDHIPHNVHVQPGLFTWSLVFLVLGAHEVAAVRTHSALGNVLPAGYAALSNPARQWDGSLELNEGSAPSPIASPSYSAQVT
jgi:hypothetical protein